MNSSKNKIVFDIDGVVCNNTWGEYEKAIPDKDAIEYINKLYDLGHNIVFYTARGFGKYDGDIEMIYANMYNFTKDQLERWGIKFHSLVLGKPDGDIYVDDHAIRADGSWYKCFDEVLNEYK